MKTLTPEQFKTEMDKFFDSFDPPTLRKRAEGDWEYKQAESRLDIARCQELAMILIKGQAKSVQEAKKLKDFY
jgi:hypothetical protein